jgi:hypothetical protein
MQVLTAVSLMIALLSSLSTFFQWDSTWQSRMKTFLNIQGLLENWELAMLAATDASEPHQAALLATQQLFKDAHDALSSETNEFFSKVQWPTVSNQQKA